MYSPTLGAVDLRQFDYLVAVADTGSFTRAAASLQVAQPSLSQAIRSLEVELGVELFHRTTRSVRLTPAGEAILPSARQALRDADNARAAVAAVVGLQAGRLDIVCPPRWPRTRHPPSSVRSVRPTRR
jgi:DNA-binding transcriptional LysR family regulator